MLIPLTDAAATDCPRLCYLLLQCSSHMTMSSLKLGFCLFYRHLSKQHNNTNIIAFGARVIGMDMAKMIVDEWINAEFEGGRHEMRVAMITEIEKTGSLKAVDGQ